MLLSKTRVGTINKIISGCKDLVDVEEETYRKRVRLKVSYRYLIHLSINQHLLSTDSKENFRPKNIENALPELLKTKDYYSDVSRSLRWHVTKNVLNYNPNFRPEHLPGRRKQGTDELYSLSGQPSFYSSHGYRLVFERVARNFISRAIIYTNLRDSNVLKRLFQVMVYNALITLRSRKPTHILKGIKLLGLGTESSFNESKYIQDQKMLLRKNKKEIMSLASERANRYIEEIDWQSRFYTEFFIIGGLTYYEVPPA